jgi:DNA repair photolyase
VKPVSNPPNPWLSTHVEYLDDEPPPEAALEIYEEQARSILSENDSPDLGFRWSLNPYRGCFHSCSYCVSSETPVLLADGRSRPIRDLRVGDLIVGTELRGRYRRFVATPVLAHWSTTKPGYRIRLADGTELVASGDHRFLTERGWKYVAPSPPGSQRPYLTTNNWLLGVGAMPAAPEHSNGYKQGYLCGMVRGDALLKSYEYDGRRREKDRVHQFRLALIDLEALARSRRFLEEFEVSTHEFEFQAAAGARKALRAIRTSVGAHVGRIRELIEWPAEPDDGWAKGFLAGIFDAEGGRSQHVLRITNGDPVIIEWILRCARRFGFDCVVETAKDRPMHNVRIRGGLGEHLRFFHLTDPVITRKRVIEGSALKCRADLRIVSVEPLGVDLPMYDITTGTGDFIANGVISHNCYARPSHQYLGWGAGTDFDRKIVVKTNAAALLREAFMKKSWAGETIMFSGITDCYQPVEASYGITRACLEVCEEFSNPVGVITKSKVIQRDVDLFGRLARTARASVTLSIPFARDDMARKIEPYASPPSRRFETLKMMSDAGVRTGIAIAPVIPGLNDPDIPELLERARAAGATHAFMTLLRLPLEVRPVFQERIRETLLPERVRRIEHAVVELRGGTGKMNEARFGDRFVGQGERWKAIEGLFDLHYRRLGFGEGDADDERPATTFRRPKNQLDLF